MKRQLVQNLHKFKPRGNGRHAEACDAQSGLADAAADIGAFRYVAGERADAREECLRRLTTRPG